MWPWSQSWSESYLVNEVVISVVSFSDLYKTHVWWFFSPAVSEGHMMLPAVVKLCCGISYPHVRSMTGKRMTSHRITSRACVISHACCVMLCCFLQDCGVRLWQRWDRSSLTWGARVTSPVLCGARWDGPGVTSLTVSLFLSFHLLELNIANHIILLNLTGFTDIYFILILIYIRIFLYINCINLELPNSYWFQPYNSWCL